MIWNVGRSRNCWVCKRIKTVENELVENKYEDMENYAGPAFDKAFIALESAMQCYEQQPECN